MFAVFLRILNNAVLSSFVVGAVILMRLILRRSPKWLTAATWGLVAIRLLLPFSLASPTSLIPNAKPLEAIGVFESADESAVPAAEKGDPAVLANAVDEDGHDASEKVTRTASEPTEYPGSVLTPAEQRGYDPAHPYSDVTDAAHTADAGSEAIFDPVKSEPEAVTGEKAVAPGEVNDPVSEASASADKAAAPASKSDTLASEANTPAFEAAAKAGEAKASPDADEPGTATSPAAAHAIGTVVMWIWFGAAIALIGFEIGSYLVTRLRLRTATRLEDGVFQSERVPGPFVLGFFRPRIYMPYRISEGAAKYALEHERAHIKRRDNIAKPLAFVLVAVYWFDPLVWLAYVLFCRDIELACDEKVIRAYDEKERRAYASALLEIGSGRNLMNTVICPLAFGNVSVKERIKKVVNYKKVSALAVAAAILLGALTAAFFLTDPISADKDGNLKFADTASEAIASEPGTAARDTDADTASADGTERGAGPILAPGVKLDADPTFSAGTEPVETEPADMEPVETEPAEPTETKPAETTATEITEAGEKTAETIVLQKPSEPNDDTVEDNALVLTGAPGLLEELTGMKFPSPDGKLDLDRICKLYEAAERICAPGAKIKLAYSETKYGDYVIIPRLLTDNEKAKILNDDVDAPGELTVRGFDYETLQELCVIDTLRMIAVTDVFWQLVTEYLPKEATYFNSQINIPQGWAILDLESTEWKSEEEIRAALKDEWYEYWYDFPTLRIEHNNGYITIDYRNGLSEYININEKAMEIRVKLIEEYSIRERRTIKKNQEPLNAPAEGHSGDANRDGKVDIEDVKKIAAWYYYLRSTEFKSFSDFSIDRIAADVSGDYRIDLNDAIRLAYYLGYSIEDASVITELIERQFSKNTFKNYPKPYECSFTEEHSGDVNKDGVTDVEDLKSVIAVVNTNVFWKIEDGAKGNVLDPAAADFSDDGFISVKDYIYFGSALGLTFYETMDIRSAVYEE